jgi:predicted XRE-type DNA-binding protein
VEASVRYRAGGIGEDMGWENGDTGRCPGQRGESSVKRRRGKTSSELTPEEEAYIELRFALSQSIKFRRKEKRLTQKQLAQLLDSSQSRVAKLEAGDASVSLDLLMRSLLALGTSLQDSAQIIALADATSH